MEQQMLVVLAVLVEVPVVLILEIILVMLGLEQLDKVTMVELQQRLALIKAEVVAAVSVQSAPIPMDKLEVLVGQDLTGKV
tara:strand:+ start:200 stop:442 length:243 start_codon:yes stop_codon:yes gene_type:complete